MLLRNHRLLAVATSRVAAPRTFSTMLPFTDPDRVYLPKDHRGDRPVSPCQPNFAKLGEFSRKKQFQWGVAQQIQFTVGTFVTLMSVGVTAMMMASVSGAADMYPNTVGVLLDIKKNPVADKIPTPLG